MNTEKAHITYTETQIDKLKKEDGFTLIEVLIAITIFAVGLLAGIGFTMSLFIGMLAFEGQGNQYAAATRIGVFSASIISATAGYLVLRKFCPIAKPQKNL